jgi:putative hydrolase of HD superfamily
MSSTPLKDQIAFLQEIEKLKGVLRANKTIDGRYENSAEHSWHVALVALLLEEHASSALDILKVTKLLLIHDIVEIDAGDTWLYEEN